MVAAALSSVAHALPGLGPPRLQSVEPMGRYAVHSELDAPPRGRPLIVLDQLEFPPGIAGTKQYVQHLRRVLSRETRRADWGAGRGARIEYRFSVTDLTLERKQGVLVVDCTAVGQLPRGKTARSRISFGGDPAKPRRTVKQVLEIVARGVITRLAELERERRERR
jgi:hypothetical protein